MDGTEEEFIEGLVREVDATLDKGLRIAAGIKDDVVSDSVLADYLDEVRDAAREAVKDIVALNPTNVAGVMAIQAKIGDYARLVRWMIVRVVAPEEEDNPEPASDI